MSTVYPLAMLPVKYHVQCGRDPEACQLYQTYPSALWLAICSAEPDEAVRSVAPTAASTGFHEPSMPRRSPGVVGQTVP